MPLSFLSLTRVVSHIYVPHTANWISADIHLAFGLHQRNVLLHVPHGEPAFLREAFACNALELRDKIKNLCHTFYHTLFAHSHISRCVAISVISATSETILSLNNSNYSINNNHAIMTYNPPHLDSLGIWSSRKTHPHQTFYVATPF